jgi:DNA primase
VDFLPYGIIQDGSTLPSNQQEAVVPYIDFGALKERISIEDAAQTLGLNLHKTSNQLRGPCPACRKGGDRALAITPSKNLFFCFGNEAGGDQIALVAHIRGCKVSEAAELLAGMSTVASTVPRTGTGTVSKDRATVPEEHKGRANGLSPLDYLDAEHAAVEAAGFNPEEAKALGIGYAPKGIMRGTVAVPIRDQHGTLLGYIGVTEARCPPKGFFNNNVVKFQKMA